MEEWVNEFQWHHTTEGNTTHKKGQTSAAHNMNDPQEDF